MHGKTDAALTQLLQEGVAVDIEPFEPQPDLEKVPGMDTVRRFGRQLDFFELGEGL